MVDIDATDCHFYHLSLLHACGMCLGARAHAVHAYGMQCMNMGVIKQLPDSG